MLYIEYFQVQRLLDKIVPKENNVRGKVDFMSQELQQCVKARCKGGRHQQQHHQGKIVNSLRLELDLCNSESGKSRKALQLETFDAVDKSPLEEFLPFWTFEESPYKLI